MNDPRALEGDGPAGAELFRRVVTQHIADGLTSGDPAAEALARSLITELDAAGITLDTAAGA